MRCASYSRVTAGPAGILNDSKGPNEPQIHIMRSYIAYLILVTVFSMCLLFIVTWSYSKLTGTSSQPHIHFILLRIHTDNIKAHFIKSYLPSKFSYRKSVGVFYLENSCYVYYQTDTVSPPGNVARMT